jgi:type II secretion system protein G
LGSGFTLIELLVVIGVIGVLAGVLVILIDPATQLKKARDANRKSDLSLIRSALELYRSDIGNYPSEDDITTGSAPKPLDCNVSFTGGTPPNTYMTKVPCDPLFPTTPTSNNYFYAATGVTPSSYTLHGCLERIDDTQRDDADGGALDKCGTGPPNGRVSYSLQNP